MNEEKFDPFLSLGKIKPPGKAVVNPDHLPKPPKGMKLWKNAGNEFAVAVCHYSSDPEKRSYEAYRQMCKGLRQDQIDREIDIDFTSKSGLKAFPFLLETPEKWLIDDIPLDQIPKHWRIIAGLDFGSTNPTSIHFYGIDERRNFISFFEFFKPSNIPEIALVLSGEHPKYRHKLFNRIERVVVDPSIYNENQQDIANNDVVSLAKLLENEMTNGGLGINLVPGINAREAGLERVRMMLNHKPLEEFESHFKMCRRCENQWREYTNLVMRELGPVELVTKNEHEDIVKKDDHSYDDSRYAFMSVDTPSDKPPKAPTDYLILNEVEKELDKQSKRGDHFF